LKTDNQLLLSTSEAEYMALADASQIAMWLRRLFADLTFQQEKATTVYEDNQGCIAMAKNPITHERTKQAH
jgi:hypothetical protein